MRNLLFEVVESCHQEELFQEELRVQHGDVGGAADQGVGRVGQGVEHVVPDQPALSGLHQRLQQIVDHLGVHRPFGTKGESFYCPLQATGSTSLRCCLRDVWMWSSFQELRGEEGPFFLPVVLSFRAVLHISILAEWKGTYRS